MRLATILILILSLNILPVSTAATFPNEPNGFRGVGWGDSFSKHKSKFIRVESKNNVSFYRRINEKMYMGRANLSMIAYRFYKNRFTGVLVFAKRGAENKYALIRELKSKYGPGNKPFKGQERYLWQGDKTRIYLECKPSQQNCTLLLLSMKMARIEKNDR